MAATAGTAANQERPKGRLADRRHAPASDPPAAPCFTSSNHGRRRPRRSIGADPVIRGSASQPGLISRSALPLRTSTGHAGCPSASPPVAAPLDDRDQSQGRPQDARTRGEGRGRLGRRRTQLQGEAIVRSGARSRVHSWPRDRSSGDARLVKALVRWAPISWPHPAASSRLAAVCYVARERRSRHERALSRDSAADVVARPLVRSWCRGARAGGPRCRGLPVSAPIPLGRLAGLYVHMLLR
jgi:hypothetical protein